MKLTARAANQGLNDGVFAFSALDDDLRGGAFDQTTDGTLTNLGLSSWVYVLVPVDNDLYLGGEFNNSGDNMVPFLRGIARYGSIDAKIYLPLVIR